MSSDRPLTPTEASAPSLRTISRMGSFRAALLLVLTACGGAAGPAVSVDTSAQPPSPEPSTTATTEPADGYAANLADARKIRDDLLGRSTPKPPKQKTKDMALKFVSTEVKSWYEEVKPRVELAEAAYGAAHKSAATAAERAVVLGEVAEVDATFVERFLSVGSSAMPNEWRADKEISSAYRDSLYGAVDPYLVRAKNSVALCDSVARGDAKCVAVGTRLQAIERDGPRPPP